MEYLENLSRKLESTNFTDPNNRVAVPCPQSVLRYLHRTPNDVNKLSGALNGMNLQNDRLSCREGYSNSLLESGLSRHMIRPKRKRGQNHKLNCNQNQPSVSSPIRQLNHPEKVIIKDTNKELEVFEAFIRINTKNIHEAYVASPDKTKDILINGIRTRHRALDGDKVVVKILDKSEWRNPDTEDCQRTGEVQSIIERRENIVIVGHLLADEKSTYNGIFTLIPKDPRLPKVFVSSRDWREPIFWKPSTTLNKESKEIYYGTVPSDVWYRHKTPIGILKGVLGDSGDINAETRGLLVTYNIPEDPYPNDIDQYFPPPFTVEEELKHRKDFRKHCIFSIDPPTAKDLDDALSCVLLPNGNYEVGIHISDVSHFVQFGTPLDKIAQKLATSVYLVQRVYHMLPPALTMMASLLPGTDKLAVSIILEITPDGIVVNHTFNRSIIHSCAQLHYAHAQIFLENPDQKNWKASEFPTVYNGYTIDDCAKTVCHLHKLAVVMRKKRFNSGALAINQPKLSFEIDKNTCEPLSYSLYILHESNWLIEEFMLLANTLVADHLKTAFPNTALLRNHQPPESVQAERTAKFLKAYGINIDFTSAGTIQKSKTLYAQGENAEDYLKSTVINNILSKPMVRAEYCVINQEKNMTHFALNVNYYTHFTSPIRRYPDIVVHRLLISCITDKPFEPYNDPEVIHQIALNSNDQKNNAKKASEASAEMYAAYLVGKLGGLEEYASVADVKENYFEALVLSMNINVRVYVNISPQNPDLQHKSSKYFLVDNKPTLTIVWDTENDIKQTLQLFTKVKLKLRKKESGLQMRAILIRDD